MTTIARHHLPDFALGLAVAVMWTTVGISRHRRMATGMDLAMFDEAIRNVAAGRIPVATMKAPGFPLWADHFHPALSLLAPLYWLSNSPEVLLAAQGVCIGATAAGLAAWGRARIGLAGWWLGALLGIGPGVVAGATFDFHEVVLGMPVLALGLAWLSDGRSRRAALVLALLVLVKEDAAFFLAGAGVAFTLRGAWRTGAALTAWGVGWTAAVTAVVIPALSPVGCYLFASKMDPGRISDMLPHSVPSLAMAALVMVLGAGVWTARSPLAWVVVVPLAVRAASTNPNYWVLYYHYWLWPAVALTVGAIDTLRRHPAQLSARVLGVAVAALVCSATVLPALRTEVEADRSHVGAARAALAMVPDGTRVGTDVYLASQASGRAFVSQVRPTGFVDDLGQPIDVDWLVLDRLSPGYGGGWTWVDDYLAGLGGGWRVVSDDGRYVVARR